MPTPTDLKYYTATSSQSLYDVCLATYGLPSLLSKLMRDNGISSMSYRPYSGQRFQYDKTLVADEVVEATGYKYTTAADRVVEGIEYLVTEDSDLNVDDPGFRPFCKENDVTKLFIPQ